MILPCPDPDFSRLLTVLRRQGVPDRVPLIEFWCDPEMMEALGGRRLAPWTESEAALDAMIHFWYVAGFDYVCVGPLARLPSKYIAAEDTAPLKRERRSWMDEGIGVIAGWEDFERYPWPRPEQVDYTRLEYVARHLPEGMRIIGSADPGGQMELLNTLMGYTGLSYALHDDPALVAAVAVKIEDLLVATCTAMAEMPAVGAIVLGDDMGFKTATLISPADLRRYVFPCHRKLARIAHAHDKPLILHSCGALGEIMDELIDDIGFDAKHSFEDVIEPVTVAKARYGSRIALLGGIDMDLLSRAGEEEVRRATRRTIEACAPGGGWALGSGNTLANYIPVENYVAMIEEGRRHGTY